MTHDDTPTASTATDPTPRLILTPEARQLLTEQATHRGHTYFPGLIIGHRYAHTVIVTHVESRYYEHHASPSRRNIAVPYDHFNGWKDGYRAALALSGQQQLGWWMITTDPYAPADLIDVEDAHAILSQPEYRVHPDRFQPTDRILILVTWMADERMNFHAIDLIAAVTRQEILEIL